MMDLLVSSGRCIRIYELLFMDDEYCRTGRSRDILLRSFSKVRLEKLLDFFIDLRSQGMESKNGLGYCDEMMKLCSFHRIPEDWFQFVCNPDRLIIEDYLVEDYGCV